MDASLFAMANCSLTVLLIASLACFISGTAEAETAKLQPLVGRPLYRRSGDVGVTHCALPGIVNGQHILLHVWVRAFLQPAAPAPVRQRLLAAHGSGPVRVHVKGFMTVENLEHYPRDWKIHVEEHSGPVARELQPRSYIRPLNSSVKYNLVSSLTYLWTVSGDFDLDSEKQQGEFEFGVYGFKYMCSVMATWQDGAHPDRSAAGLERPGQIAMLISPCYGSSAAQIAALLAWHIAWHRKLGVDVYVMYATGGLAGLLDVPQIKELVLAGTLHLVLWQDMPLGDPEETSKSYSRYGQQTQIYNHAMLALNAKDTVVLVADLDEYLVTPQPMSARQVMSDCLPNRGPVGAMRLQRFNVFHEESVERRQDERALWALTSESLQPDVAAHPLLQYSICGPGCSVAPKYARSSLMYSFKSIYAAMQTTVVWIHHGYVNKGAVAGDGDAQCAHWLHVVNQNSLRIGEQQELAALRPEWLWPALPGSTLV